MTTNKKDQQHSEEPKFEHTSEPWIIQNNCKYMWIKADGGDLCNVTSNYVGGSTKADFERIVAVINLTAGLSLKEIERRLKGFEVLEEALKQYADMDNWRHCDSGIDSHYYHENIWVRAKQALNHPDTEETS